MAAGTGNVAGQQFTGTFASDEAWRRRLNKAHPINRQVGLADRLQYLTSTGSYTGPTSEAISFIADTGGVAAGDICAVTGYDATTGFMKLDKADANAVATARDLYWSPNAVAAAATGFARKSGMFTSALNTSGSTLGDPVYLSATAGGISLSKPATAAATDVIVEIGTVASLDGSAGVIHIDLAGGDRIIIHDHTDNDEGGTISIGAGLTGTTETDWNINTGGNQLILDSSGLSQNSTFTFFDVATGVVLSHAAGVLQNTITDITTMQHDHADAAGGGLIAAASSSTGTTNLTFSIDSDANAAILSASGLSQNSTFTFNDAAGPDELAGIAATQTFTNKTLTDPTINACTITGAVAITTPTVTGTWTDLGTVTTADINGGTIDGVTIGAGSAPTVTDLGAVATCDINGGAIDGCTIGAASPSTIVGTTLNCTDANLETIVVDDGTTPTIALAAGSTNTGTITVNGKTSGSLIITTADSTAQPLTFQVAAQTAGASSATIPDLANSAQEILLEDTTQTITNKTIDGDDNTVQDLPFTCPKELAYASNIGKGIPFIISAEFTAAGTFSYTVDNGTHDLQVIKAWGYKKTAAGAHVDDDIDIKNSGSSNNIFATEELNGVNDGDYFEFSGFDDAEDVVSDGDDLQIVASENAANGCDALVHVLCVWV
jgi:hypothetical protein